MLSVRHVDRAQIRPSDTFLFDANIWLTLHYFQRPDRGFASYSRLFNQILRERASVLINFLVLGEVVNRIAKHEFDVFRQIPGNVQKADFKRDFRDTSQFKDVQITITDTVNRILKVSTEVDMPPPPFQPVLTEAYRWNVDLNDAAIASCCARHNATLVSHDKDMARVAGPLELLTANGSLTHR